MLPSSENSKLCQPIGSAGSESSKAKEASSSRSRWWPWSKWKDSNVKSASSDSSSNLITGENNNGIRERPFEGKVVLGLRGQCMFEDKVKNAEDAGAAAVIIANSEVKHGFAIPCVQYHPICFISQNCLFYFF